MESLHVVHLLAVGCWGAVVCVELVLELRARDQSSRRSVARAHYVIDLALELPLIVLVVATGAWLAVRAYPFSLLHWIKIAAGLIAVVANLVCVGLVIQRFRKARDPAALERYGKLIRASALGVPFGLFAFSIGLAYFQV